MDRLVELAGVGLAWAYTVYGFVFLVLPGVLFAYLPLLAAVFWTAVSHSRGRQPWPSVPDSVRKWVRLGVEVVFGLINPVLYLAILSPSIPGLSGGEWWAGALTASAWVLLAAFWMLRIFGAALDPGSRTVRAGVRTLLVAALVCLLLFSLKDAWFLWGMDWSTASWSAIPLSVLRLCPLYLVPALLLWDYIRSTSTPPAQAAGKRLGLFLLPDRAARLAVAGAVGVALVTFAFAAHRRSDATVRQLVSDHREPIRAAAARYDVDPRLVGSIVYVTHRDHLSPFRGALERLLITAWAKNMRRELGLRPPDRVDQIGTDENPMLNRALDISVGLAQIKPRTAQTASVLATGRTPDDLPRPAVFSYRDVEPIGNEWTLPAAERTKVIPPFPVPAERHTVADALLDTQSNLATCALILALYQNQWEVTNPLWSLRQRPDILATLYQIGFARSKPHGAPRSNAFGSRVGQIYEQPWLGDLFGAVPRPPR